MDDRETEKRRLSALSDSRIRGMYQSWCPVDLTVCPCCLRHSADVACRVRNSAYVDDSLNYLTSCGDCYREDTEHLQDLWDEYNNSRW